ncbi:hypothetical protein N7463_006473 [Penicillium fimorum]|uniref:SET domain-containing protein n=1 Tax=Penicillium fimorum TaxID=1882269 RepID=A0A9X0C634_9EURO|nr:hypothetical protein N7463_006473 [Penicillium fimorum]
MRLTRHAPVKRWYAEDLIEFKESAQKGLGVFAKTNIPRGTRVISENALLEIDIKTVTLNSIVPAFEHLPPSQQKSYLELYGYAGELFKHFVEYETGKSWQELPEVHRKVLAIYAANAFGYVFFLGSRINHSCIPNVNFAYNPILREEVFHVIRDIVAGEELTVMYIDGTNLTQGQRQNELSRYGFQCTCPACEDTVQGRQRERKRAELAILDQELAATADDGTNESYRKRLQVVQKMSAIQKSEGLLNRQLRFVYYEAAKCCLKLKEQTMAYLWIEKIMEVDLYCVGKDHPEYRKMLTIAEVIRRAVSVPEPISEGTVEWFMKD